MNKITIAVIGLVMASTAYCEAKPTRITYRDMTPEQQQKMREARMRHSGGFVKVPGSGHLAVLNAQKQFGTDALAAVVSPISNFAQGGVRVEFTEAPFSISTARAEREKNGAGACVFLIDDATLPMSLISLEEGWGFVNVAPLREGEPGETKFAARFRKEFVRVSSVVFGGVKSQYKTSPLQSVTSLRELDKMVGEEYGMDTLIALAAHMPEIGVIHDQRLTYREACRRGVAPAPTNDVQKAIWDDVHKIPSNPMKIEFDPKKGR